MDLPTGPFPWRETADRLRRLRALGELVVVEGGRAVELRGAAGAAAARLAVPPLLPIEGGDLAAYLAEFPDRLGRHLILLFQAGAAALGVWDEDQLAVHKVLSRYVVRGHGRAQPTHLRTRGKSRYGARLRLQNAKALLVEVGERLHDWWSDPGPADHVSVACPERLWHELRASTPGLPFAAERAQGIPTHVHAPRFEELLRVRRFLVRGRIDPR